MNDKFFDLKKEKQDRMINGALKIFALNGYQKASTDDIVREAGISKGLLFHYFGSKAGVYVFAYEYSARYMSMELQRAVSLRERDLFRLLSQVEDAKSVLLRNYPYMQKFLLTHEQLQEEALQKEIAEYTPLVPNAMNEVLDRADYDRLLPDVDKQLLLRLIRYTTRGMMEAALVHQTDAETVHREAKAFCEMMRLKFTKAEYLKEPESGD